MDTLVDSPIGLHAFHGHCQSHSRLPEFPDLPDVPAAQQHHAPPIYAIPPELLDAILASFPTATLIRLAAVSRLFHDVVARLLYRRLRRALALQNHQLVLECYHPSDKAAAPYLQCTYAGTDGLDCGVDGDDDTPGATLLRLPGMYSRFRPRPAAGGRMQVRSLFDVRRPVLWGTPAETEQSSTTSSSSSSSDGNDNGDPPLVSSDVGLDGGDLFSQLCIVTNLVKTSPRQGVFLDSVGVADGVVRVWRDWLADRSQQKRHNSKSTASDDAAILWSYTGKNVGIKFRVTETTEPAEAPVALGPGGSDAVPVSYRLEHEALFVRTYAFLRAVEEAEAAYHAGRAIVILSLF